MPDSPESSPSPPGDVESIIHSEPRILDTPPASDAQISANRSAHEQYSRYNRAGRAPESVGAESQFRDNPDQALKQLSDISAHVPAEGELRDVVESKREQLEKLWTQKHERRAAMQADLVELGLERLMEVDHGHRAEAVIFDYDRSQTAPDLYGTAEAKQTIDTLFHEVGQQAELVHGESSAVKLNNGATKVVTTHYLPDSNLELTEVYLYSPIEVLDQAAVLARRAEANVDRQRAA